MPGGGDHVFLEGKIIVGGELIEGIDKRRSENDAFQVQIGVVGLINSSGE